MVYKYIHLFFFLINISCVFSDSYNCPLDWIADRYNPNICYQIHTEKATWLSAEKECLKEGGNVVSVSSKDSYEQLEAHEDVDTSYWLGATNQFDGKYSWVDGAPMSYVNYAKGMNF